jgi:hypothetical protein
MAFHITHTLEVDPTEVAIDIDEMRNKGHNVADFGVYKSFIYTGLVDVEDLLEVRKAS